MSLLELTMLLSQLTPLLQKYPPAELLNSLATAYDIAIKEQNLPTTVRGACLRHRLKREVTIQGLRDLAKHEQDWS